MTKQHEDPASTIDRTVTRRRRGAIALLLALPLLATAITGCDDTEGPTETAQPAGLVATSATPIALASETPSEEATPEAWPSPEPEPTPTTTAPAPEPEPSAVAVPAPAPVAAPAPAPELDPKFKYCKDAVPAGYGNYVRGVDPEYDWYRDADGDGIVCEF